MRKFLFLTAVTFSLALLGATGTAIAGEPSPSALSAPMNKKMKKVKEVPVSTPTTAGGAMEPDGMGHAQPCFTEGAVTMTPMPIMIRKVSVLIESTPTNSDIEVNGVYIGATPLQVSLKEGVHYLKVSKEGFLSWQRAVKAFNGLYVSATLVKTSTTKDDVTRSATAQ